MTNLPSGNPTVSHQYRMTDASGPLKSVGRERPSGLGAGAFIGFEHASGQNHGDQAANPSLSLRDLNPQVFSATSELTSKSGAAIIRDSGGMVAQDVAIRAIQYSRNFGEPNSTGDDVARLS